MKVKGWNRVARFDLAAAMGCFLVSLWPSALVSQCTPPEGTYEYSISWSSSTAYDCYAGEITISVLLSSTQPVQGTGIFLDLYINSGSRPIVTVDSIEPGADIPPGWITLSSQCNGYFSQKSVSAGFLAGPNPENPPDAIPSGDEKEICRIKLKMPPLPSPGTFFVLLRNQSSCGGFVFSNHIVVEGCDADVSLYNGKWWSSYSMWYVAPLADTSCKLFRRGDCNNNGQVEGKLGDIVFLLCHLFASCPCSNPPCYEPPCQAACDANDDGAVELTDAIYLANWMFKNDPPPPPPYPDCGLDPTEPTLPCETTICP
jgi:hypothetical protein